MHELVALTEQLLGAIAARDWKTYQKLCDPSLTAFEPEARGHLVQGLDFHRFYFDLDGKPPATHVTMIAPHVREMGDAALVAYVRLVQRTNRDGTTETLSFEETRIWQRREGQWRHVHFHRSAT